MRKLVITFFFLLGLLVALIWWMPVRFVLSLVEQGNMRFEAATGTLSNGSLVVSSKEVKAVPIGWEMCSLRLTQPIGVCLDMSSGQTKLAFGVVPWKLGDEVTLYNIVIDSPLADLSKLGQSLSALALVEGHVTTYFPRLVYNQRLQVLEELQGSARFENTAALGLQMGDINLEITQETPGDIINLAFEGGDINELVLLGSGSFEPKAGVFSIRTIFRSNKPSVLGQLAGFAKKTGDNSYEWVYNTTL